VIKRRAPSTTTHSPNKIGSNSSLEKDGQIARPSGAPVNPSATDSNLNV
jgi:hypothetical protein